MRKSSALVVLSGGQDSTTCLFLAKMAYDTVHAITFDYGQRHQIEIDAAIKVAEMAGVKSHEIIKVPDCLHSTSPLTSQSELEQYENAEQMESVIGDRIELTFVPMRNSLFFIIAANRAIELGTRNIITGICQEDNANYPDCRDDFRESMERTINLSLGIQPGEGWLTIHAPLMFMSKAESVKVAYTTPGAFDALAYSHTSYDGTYPPTDMNHSNVLRAAGFEEAGYADPLVVRAWNEGLMDLPETPNYDGVELTEDKS